MGGARQTPDAGGFSGLAGDRAIDLGMGGEAAYVLISDAEFLNVAAANDDQLTLSIWVMNYEIVDSSLFWGVSHSSSSNSRGLSAHVPWSDNSVYFDTAGCCANGSQRLASNIGSFSGYSGYPNWWGSWHHFAFLKKGARKEIWIDGKFFAGGWNARPLPNDFLELWLGSGYRDGRSVHGALDEFAVFGNALSQPDIIKLAAGAAPTELSGNARLFAHWNFDDSGASADGGTVDP
jgi:hypothetical protein